MGRTEASSVCLVGQLLAYELKGCKIYRIRLGDASGEYRLKLGDRARNMLMRAAIQNEIQMGDWVQVLVSRKVKFPKKGRLCSADDELKLKVKLKVRSIERVQPPAQPEQQASLQTDLQLCFPPATSDQKIREPRTNRSKANHRAETDTGSPVKVLVCQKSGCCKRGGKAMYKALSKAVEQEGLGDRIQLKPTGCLGKCSKGPNIVINKTRHHHMEAKTVEKVLASYLR